MFSLAQDNGMFRAFTDQQRYFPLVAASVPSTLDHTPNTLDSVPRGGNSNSHGARPVDRIITMIKWIRTDSLSIKNALSPKNTFHSWQPRYSTLNPKPSTLNSKP